MGQGSVTTFSAGNSKLEVSIDGKQSFVEIPYVGDVECPESPAPTSEVVTYKGIASVVGAERIPPMNIALPSYAPHLAIFADLRIQRDAKNSIWWRFTTSENSLLETAAPNTAALSAAGVVTLVGDPANFLGDDYGVGLALEIAGTKYILDEIDPAGQATVRNVDRSAVSAPVAAEVYRVIKPSLRQEFLGQIQASAGWSLPADAQLTASMTIQPNSMPPQFIVIA